MHSGDGPRPTPWRVVESRAIIKDRWIDLRADSCIDALGRNISPYYVLDQADWVTVLALDLEGRVITVEEYHHGVGAVALGLVGGGVDDDENPRDAAVRELREETGYEPTEVIDLGASWANWGNQTNRSHHFLALGCSRTAEQSLDSGEIISVHLEDPAMLGPRLQQSYHQLTWLKAAEWLRERT